MLPVLSVLGTPKDTEQLGAPSGFKGDCSCSSQISSDGWKCHSFSALFLHTTMFMLLKHFYRLFLLHNYTFMYNVRLHQWWSLSLYRDISHELFMDCDDLYKCFSSIIRTCHFYCASISWLAQRETYNAAEVLQVESLMNNAGVCVLFICCVDTDTVAALLMGPRLSWEAAFFTLIFINQ